jgi:transposase
MDTLSVRDMMEALIAGERDPKVLARLARGRMKAKHAELVQALTGRFDAHHGELARILLDQIDALTVKIDQLTTRIEELVAELPEAAAPEPGDPTDQGVPPVAGQPDQRPGDRAALSAIERLDEIPGIDVRGAQIILAEVGLDMTRFPTADHLASWAKLTPRTIQSGAKSRGGKTGKGNPYLKGLLGEAAAAAAKTQTFLGDKYRRLVKRRGKLKALVAVARSILVAVWHLRADPATRFHDLGVDYHANRTNTEKKIRNHVRQIEALGFTVTLNPVAA